MPAAGPKRPFPDVQPDTSSFRGMYPVTKASADLPQGTCKGLVCGTPGTANLRDAHGNDLANYPLQQGYNPLQVQQVQPGGTAADIWAGY